MDSEKRLFIAIALSVLVIYGYNSYVYKFYKKHPAPNVVVKQTQVTAQKPPSSQGVIEDRSDNKPISAEGEKTVTIENKFYRAVLTDYGAGIKELYLMQFKDKKGRPLLFSQLQVGQPAVLEASETTGQTGKSQWRLVKDTSDEVAYEKVDDNKIAVKKFKFSNTNYSIELELNIKSKIGLPQDVGYKVTGGSDILFSDVDRMYITADAQMADKVYRRKPSQKSLSGGELFPGAPEWVATKSRYFSFILKPEQPEQAAFIESVDKRHIFSGIILGPVKLGPGEEIAHKFLLYAGPNDTESISAVGPELSNVVNYGAFNGIAILMLKALKLFYNIFHSYGIAIIVLSLLISALVFPLTRKSLTSMKEMQRVQPEAEKIRKEFGDNPQKMNKEIMELYKKHNINPMGGCLPMFLQFPVFIALYQVLMRSVKLKGASFLWIKDLSEADSVFKLPYRFPIVGEYINILPLLMIVAMVLQQKISQPKGAETTEQQRMMGVLFPIIMGFIFYNLPSGLVLYWLTNTIIMIIIQEVVLKRTSAPTPNVS